VAGKAHYGSFLHSAIKAIEVRIEKGEENCILEQR